MLDKKKYIRPYCKNCRLIWAKQSIGYVLNCTKCGQPLINKSFNPWINVCGGFLVLILGLLTLMIDEFPIIWIGGFVFGIALMGNGINQWQKIKKTDQDLFSKKKTNLTKIKKNQTIITCGKCFQKIIVPKNKILKVKCPKCSLISKIST